MKRYTTLLMDADETLLDFCRSEGYALSTTLESVGITMTPSIQEQYHEINRLLWQKLERTEIEREQLKVLRFEQLFEQLGVAGVDVELFSERYMQVIGTKGFILDGADRLLADLSAEYTIHLITNGTACVQHTRLADSGLLPYVDKVFISQEIGADKPSPRFFEYVCRAIGDPDKSKLLIIGDSLTSDIRGGLLSGIDTCWFNPTNHQAPPEITPTMQVTSFEELRECLLHKV